MPRIPIQVVAALVLLVSARAVSAGGEGSPSPVPCASPMIGRFIASACLDLPDPLDRERFLLKRVHGPDAFLAVEWAAGAAFLLPVKAGRPIPGSPPRERPTYGDLFDEGTCICLCGRFSMRPALDLVLRGGFEYYRGKTITEGVLGRVGYGSMWIIPVLAGLRLGFPLALPPSSWWTCGFCPLEKGAFPFVEALAGVAHRTGIDHEPSGPYWGSATVFAADAAAGIEYRFGGLTVFASVCFAYRSEPPERVWYADPEAVMALLLRGGLGWRF